ncbi:AAA family ATPase [Endozoicomonas sp. ALD068]|uniref:AAA family ATPase n=1 Tax=Endozoicomonas sp. ALD068 TaxID=3403080 RepID=UPI003BB5D5E4
MTVVVGKNGVGKSSLFDAFGFLADCLKFGVDEACHRNGRGGFERLRSGGSDNNIEFEIYYRESSNERPITYELSIGTDRHGRPIAGDSDRDGEAKKTGWPFSFLELNNGSGKEAKHAF